jgi:hypothetical protein
MVKKAKGLRHHAQTLRKEPGATPVCPCLNQSPEKGKARTRRAFFLFLL